MGTKARILMSTRIDDIDYQPNQVVDFPAAMARALAKEGVVDANADAVGFCIDQLGAVVVQHQSPAEPAPAEPAPVASPA